jgi:hypothetical protein
MHRMAHALLVTTVASFLALPAHAQEADATRLYNEGWRLYKEKQYAEACPLLERSVAASPKIRTRGALALCYEATGRLASAYSTWRAVADQAHEAGAVEAATLKRAVEKSAQLLPKITQVVFQVVDTNITVQVSLDGRPLTAAELRSQVPVDLGEHKLDARAPDRVDWHSSFEIGQGDAGKTRSLPIGPLAPIERVEKVELPPGTPTTERPVPPAPIVDRSPPTHPLKYIGLATAGAGVVAIGLGTVFAIGAKSKWNDAKDMGCDDNGTCRTQAGADLVSDAHSKATVGTIAFIGGIALIGGGVAMWLLAPPSSSAVKPEVSIGPDGAQLGVKGSF